MQSELILVDTCDQGSSKSETKIICVSVKGSILLQKETNVQHTDT